jgi:hypothetical protein
MTIDSGHPTRTLSTQRRVDELGEQGLYRLAMADPAEATKRLAQIDAVLRYVREELCSLETRRVELDTRRVELDNTRVGLEHMAKTLRQGLAGAPDQSKARAERGPSLQVPAVSTDRLRVGSKKHRLYVAIEACLRDGPMHVDNLRKNLPPELFEDIHSDIKTNLFNRLSQLKHVGLLTSDNRGNWRLPDKE